MSAKRWSVVHVGGSEIRGSRTMERFKDVEVGVYCTIPDAVSDYPFSIRRFLKIGPHKAVLAGSGGTIIIVPEDQGVWVDDRV